MLTKELLNIGRGVLKRSADEISELLMRKSEKIILIKRIEMRRKILLSGIDSIK